MINAIVSAAGESKRMGKPKALLRFGDRTFLEQIVAILRSSRADRITVVLGAQADAIAGAVDLLDADVVVNRGYRSGQLSSVVAGLEHVPQQAEAILLCLVDHPFITSEIVDRIVDEFRRTKAPIVVPTFNGRRGHPTLFGRSMFEALISAPVDKGARHVLHSNENEVLEVAVRDGNILVGINTTDEYRSCFGTNP
ncbi:MAG: nucleotidyltransferase family protein [Sedimentisphaerales bacterium]|nr:nucleotidyltransferase family protein [Sedimentisphaerales bacterium]